MTSSTEVPRGEVLADESEALNGPIKTSLPQRRPAELATVVTGVIVLATALGFDLSEEVVLAGLAVVAGLPAVVTWIVTLYRDTVYGEPPREEGEDV